MSDEERDGGALLRRLDAYQRAHPHVGFPLAVLRKFSEDSGGYLAAVIAYYAFLSLFPLLLVATTVLGIALSGHPDLQQRLLNGALRDFPVVGSSLSTSRRIGGGAVGLTIGLLGATYGGMQVGQAMQYVANVVWRVPRERWPSALRSRRRSLLILTILGLGWLASSSLTTLGTTTSGFSVKALVLTASLLVNSIVFVLAFRAATDRALTIRDVLPGAVAAAIAWQVLQTFGVAYVDHVVRHASDTNGVFALVLGLLAFLHLSAASVVLCNEINAVRVDRLYPRSLLPVEGRDDPAGIRSGTP